MSQYQNAPGASQADFDNLSEHIEYVATGTEISNLDNVPLNAKGRISLAGAVSPSGNSLNCSFLCIGSANYRTITIWSTSTGNSWTTQKNGSGASWSSWISISDKYTLDTDLTGVEFSKSTNKNALYFYTNAAKNQGIALQIEKSGNNWYLEVLESTSGSWAQKAYIQLTNA